MTYKRIRGLDRAIAAAAKTAAAVVLAVTNADIMPIYLRIVLYTRCIMEYRMEIKSKAANDRRSASADYRIRPNSAPFRR